MSRSGANRDAERAGAGDEPRLTPLWSAGPPANGYAPLRGPAEADVVIVGGGFTGLSTALALAEHGASVVVLEADQPGAGASGRSGGQVIPGLRHFTGELVAAWGESAGLRAHAFGAEAAERTFDLVRREGIDCDPIQTGKIQVADTAAGVHEAHRRAENWRRMGAPAEPLDGEGVEALLGSRAYGGGWIDWRGGSVKPRALAEGLAQAAAAKGARIHGGSRALRIAREGSAWRVDTAAGRVRARRLLLATNATTDALWPGLQSAFLRVWSFQIATRPLSANLRARILPQSQAVSDTRRVIRYFRTDGEGRLVLGGKGLARAPRGAGDFAFQRMTLQRLYPELADQPIEHAWGGQVCITLDRLPRIIGLGPGAYAHLGCNGKGVAWCTAIGERFAEALLEDREGALPIPVTPLQPIPFHQFRRAYVAVGGAWLRFRDGLDALQPKSGTSH